MTQRPTKGSDKNAATLSTHKTKNFLGPVHVKATSFNIFHTKLNINGQRQTNGPTSPLSPNRTMLYNKSRQADINRLPPCKRIISLGFPQTRFNGSNSSNLQPHTSSHPLSP